MHPDPVPLTPLDLPRTLRGLMQFANWYYA